MNINDKYKRVRTTMLVLPLLAFFLLYLLFKFLLPDYFVKEENLNTDSAIIKNVFKNKYLAHERYKGQVYKTCIDITLADKPYFIRLTDHLVDNYWPVINNPNNISKRIEVKFQSRFLHDNILHNPNQISIGNRVIIPYNAKKSFIGWFAFVATLVIIVCLYFTYTSFKTYKRNLYAYDKKIGKRSKWQLFLVWLKD